MGIFKGDKYTDGYGTERTQPSGFEKAIDIAKSYLSNASNNYKELTESPIGFLYPASAGEAALMMAPGVKSAKPLTNFDKFLKWESRAQDDLVRFWWGEKYTSFKSLKGKDLASFKRWINSRK